MGVLLYIIATILFLPLTALNFVCVLWKSKSEKGFFGVVQRFFFQGAIDIDKFGNHNFRVLFNVILKKKGGYGFGRINETISSALGKNQRDGTLSWVGIVVMYILWAFDYKYWRNGGHCINSIDK